MLDNPTTMIMFGLAAWRISYMLVRERGPADLIVKLREKIGIGHDDDGDPISFPDTFLANLFSCVFCMSVWVSVGIVALSLILPDVWTAVFVLPFAVSAVAIIIDTGIEKY